MNLNEDFIAIQGIFLSVEKSASPFRKIKHRGGHETTILNITSELHKFLSSKNYIKNNKINDVFGEQLIEICTFLILNTEFSTPLDEPAFRHLMNIMPQLSTCLLANIVVALDLAPQYCKAQHRFHIDVTKELLAEMVPCIKKCKPEIHLQNAYECLKLTVIKISTTSNKFYDNCDKLTDIASQMLLNLTGLHGDQIENAKINSVYESMGYTILNLLDLLLMCPDERRQPMLNRLIEKLLKTCCSITMAVTIDVFCSWAEFEHNGEPLQSLVAVKSYLFIEKYQKYPLAKELIAMLGTIAQKPKTIDEQIQKADVPTMISMINKADSNQKQWFTALINTQVLKCQDSVKCIERWSHLCTLSDVSRLLNQSVHVKDSSMVIKCAATLDFEDLVLATTRHFYQNGISNHLNENVQDQLVVLFNKIKDKSISDEFSKELYLLVLQNFEQTLGYIFAECVKNTFYSTNLVSIWQHLKEIVTINGIGIKALKGEMNNNGPNEHNCKNYVELFNTLVKANVFSGETLGIEIILPLVQNSHNENNHEVLKYGLEILKDLEDNICVKQETEDIFSFLLDLIREYRCTFLNFNGSKQEIVKLSVDIIEKYTRLNSLPYTGQIVKSENIFVSFYKLKLLHKLPECDILQHFFPTTFENHAEGVTHLIKILPLCVTPEWLMISARLMEVCHIGKTVELLADSMVLLCELVNSQGTQTEEVKCMMNALKYCLQNLGVVIKECIQPKISDPQEDIALTKNVCRLLREIPTGNLKSEEGLSLASLLSDMSLKSLRSDKSFACLVASIHESHICKMLAQKILS